MAASVVPFSALTPPDRKPMAPDGYAFQYNLFTGSEEPISIEVDMADQATDERRERLDEGIEVVKSTEGSHVIVTGFGCWLGKKSERLAVRRGDGKVLYQFPLLRLQEVIVGSRGISVTTDLIDELCQRGIRLSLLKYGDSQPYAMVTSPMLTATVETRRAQLAAYSDVRGLDLTKAIVEGKIRNQAKLLKYFGKHLSTTSPDAFRALEGQVDRLAAEWRRCRAVAGRSIDECRGTLMAIEGAAGRAYWQGVALIIADKVPFDGRKGRGATDPVNSMLNYGYAILYSQVWGAILNAGLEPFAGFLHVDRPGKPSLVLDLIEEFRQPVVDRVVIAHVNTGERIGIQDGFLDTDTRKRVAEKVLERLTTADRYHGGKYQLRSIIQMQARRAASFLRGGAAYRSYAFKW
jgi:CRISPR-associated protein Cas1